MHLVPGSYEMCSKTWSIRSIKNTSGSTRETRWWKCRRRSCCVFWNHRRGQAVADRGGGPVTARLDACHDFPEGRAGCLFDQILWSHQSLLQHEENAQCNVLTFALQKPHQVRHDPQACLGRICTLCFKQPIFLVLDVSGLALSSCNLLPWITIQRAQCLLEVQLFVQR